jgi:ribonuclease VapC
MIIDTSALIAILRAENDASDIAHAIERARDRRISAANYLEAAVVIDGSRDPVASRRFDELVVAADLRVEPVTGEQAQIAREAYRDFGKGSGHKAGLNFGDCFAYALAKVTGEPLLYKGNDFTHTDITPALPVAGLPLRPAFLRGCSGGVEALLGFPVDIIGERALQRLRHVVPEVIDGRRADDDGGQAGVAESEPQHELHP